MPTDFTCNKSNPRLHPSHCFTTATAMDDPLGFLNLLNANVITHEIYDEFLYYSFIDRGLYVTAEVFRREIGAHFAPSSPTGPLSPIEGDVPGENSLEWLLIINEAGQVEWEAVLDEDGSFYSDEESMWQQSGLTPSIDNGFNEQLVEELTLDEIFGGTDNQGLVSVVEACQSSKVVSNECYGKVMEDGTHDFSITNDPIELSSLVNVNKNEEGDFCSQDAYLYDSSSFDLGNEDDGAIPAFSFNGCHDALYIAEIQGVTVGGNLVLQTMPHPERLMLSSSPANIEDTDSLGPHSLAQTVPRKTEIASNEHGDGGVYMPGGGNNSYSETWFPVPLYVKNFPEYSSFCSKNVEAASCSQDANMHESSLNGNGNEDNNMISFRNTCEHHGSSKNDNSKGMITGGKLVPEIMTNTENPIMCSPPPNLGVTGTEGLDSVVQAILRSVELSTNESGRKRKWFEEFGDGEGDSSTRNAHLYGSCGKGNEDDDEILHGESHQNNACPVNELQGVESTSSAS